MKFTKQLLAIVLVLSMLVGAATAAGAMLGTRVQAAGAKTGVGLSEHVMKAYNEDWQYNYGSYGELIDGQRATDCAGLIKSYLWWAGDSSNPKAGSVSVGGGASAMLNSATASGTIDYSDPSSLPRVHGLILYQPGHVGVYVGNNMAVDNRDYGLNIKYEKVFGRAKNKWTTWFKLPQIQYPTTGWATYDGQKFYYENGQYLVNATRTIDGSTYEFGADGVAAKTAGGAASSASSQEDAAAKKAAAQAKAEKEAQEKAAAQAEAQQAQEEAKLAQQAKEEQKNAISAASEMPASKEEESAFTAAAMGTEAVGKTASAPEDNTASNMEEAALRTLGVLGLNNQGASENPVSALSKNGEEDLVFSDGVLPKASAQPTILEASQQTKGMNSILALLIVVLTTGVTAVVVFQIRSRRIKAGYAPANDRSFRTVCGKKRKK